MKPFVPTRTDRWRALGLLVLGASLLAMLLVLLLRPWWDTAARLSALRRQIATTAAIQARAPMIEAALQTARENALSSGLYLPESTPALGNAALATRIQETVEAAATDTSVCTLGNRLPVASGHKPPCAEARIKVELECGVDSLEKVLRALETQPPHLRIDQMELGLVPNPLGFDKPSTNQPISASLEVAGCLLAATDATAPLAAP